MSLCSLVSVVSRASDTMDGRPTRDRDLRFHLAARLAVTLPGALLLIAALLWPTHARADELWPSHPSDYGVDHLSLGWGGIPCAEAFAVFYFVDFDDATIYGPGARQMPETYDWWLGVFDPIAGRFAGWRHGQIPYFSNGYPQSFLSTYGQWMPYSFGGGDASIIPEFGRYAPDGALSCAYRAGFIDHLSTCSPDWLRFPMNTPLAQVPADQPRDTCPGPR